ncbi:MAG: DUF3631 domain-containing protein [Candidatus Nanopelagicales bacterium]
MSDLCDLLDEVEDYAARFVAFPSDEARVAFVLWAAHAHVVDAFESTPRLALLSPEPGSGKTRALEVLELLVPRAWFTSNTSSAALFRKIGDPDGAPTVLLDEADTVFGPRAAKEHEDLRGLINAGHRRGAQSARCVVRGKTVEVEMFPAFAPVALAGLDDLPDTIMTRSIVLRMRRRAPHERVEPFRHRLHADDGHELRDRLAEELKMHAWDLERAWPDMPDGVADRAADCWEPLLAIADQAGGEWPGRARVAAVALVADGRGGGETLGIRLLADVRRAFDLFGVEHLPTAELLAALNAFEDAPWGDLRGRPLDARGLSRRLGRYDVAPKTVRVGNSTPKGYARTDLADAWARYLPAVSDEPASPPPRNSATSATAATPLPAVSTASRPQPSPGPLGTVPVHACAGSWCNVPDCPAPAAADLFDL